MIADATHPGAETLCLRPAQAAEKLGVSAATVWRWARTKPGFPKPIKLGSHVTVFRESELDAFIISMNAPQLGAHHAET